MGPSGREKDYPRGGLKVARILDQPARRFQGRSGALLVRQIRHLRTQRGVGGLLLGRQRAREQARPFPVESEHVVEEVGLPGTLNQFPARVAHHPMVVNMARALNEVRAGRAADAAAEKIDAAIRQGRLVPSQREWAIAYCASDPRGFDTFIGAQPQILSPGADTAFAGRIGDSARGVLSSNEAGVCSRLGITRDAFVIARELRGRNLRLD